MNLNINIQKLVCAGAMAALGLQARADTTLFDTYSSYNGNAFTLSSGLQIGNEITLNSSTWNPTAFSFEYYSPSATLAADVGVEVRFYDNNGPTENGFATPGTMFFDSGIFSNTGGDIAGNGFHSIFYTSTDLYGDSVLNLTPGFMLPSDFTFTVTFTGLDADNVVELPLANDVSGQPATDFGDYWSNDGTGWTLLTGAAPANLVGNLLATPEPSTYLLGFVGGALILGMNKFRKNS